MEKILAAFSNNLNKTPVGFYQEAINLIKTLRNNGYSCDDLIAWWDGGGREKIKMRKMYKFPACTECGRGKLKLVAGNELGGEAVLLCSECGYSQYDGRHVNDVIKDFAVDG